MDDLKCLNCGAEFEEIDMIDPNRCCNCGSDNYDFKFDVDFDVDIATQTK